MVDAFSCFHVELVKFTPEYNPDRKNLIMALEKMKQIATYVNETKRKYEKLEKVVLIQNAILGNFQLVDPHRVMFYFTLTVC